MVTDRAHFNRVVLQLERDLLTRASLATLLAAAHAAVLGRREELRDIKACLRGAARRTRGSAARPRPSGSVAAARASAPPRLPLGRRPRTETRTS